MIKKILSGILALGLSAQAMAETDFVPYVGADVKWNQMGFKNSAGGNLTPKNHPQGDFYAGIRFNDWIGIQAGYESSKQKSRTTTVTPGTNVFGTISPAGAAIFSATTKTRIRGFHADVVGFYPLCEENRISLIGSIGLAQLKLQSTFDGVASGVPIGHLDFVKRKMIPRVSLGVQHMLFEQFGIRAMLGWEKTSSFKSIYGVNARGITTTSMLKPKDSKSIGLGVFYSFK